MESNLTVKIGADLAGLQRGLNNAGAQFDRLRSQLQTIGSTLGIAFGAETVINFGREVINTTAKFQKFEAVLTNTLGNNSEAKQALQDITDFAAKTPFQVDELTASYVKLANQGFRPTLDQMRALGDLAAAQGKSFEQLTEAIIDAQTGEFERLKEFGIRASKEGDKVTFTFKGVQKQVDFTSDSIRSYILSLGDAQGVSGGMAAISETLGGKISNLGDAIDQFKLKLGTAIEQGGLFSGAVDLMTTSLSAMSDVVADQNFQRAFSSAFLNMLGPLGAVVAAYQDLQKTQNKTGGGASSTWEDALPSAQQIETLDTLKKKLHTLREQFAATDLSQQAKLKTTAAEIIAVEKQIDAIEKLIKTEVKRPKSNLHFQFLPDLEAEGSTNPELRNEQAANAAREYASAINQVAVSAEFAGGALIKLDETTGEVTTNIASKSVEMGGIVSGAFTQIADSFGRALVGAEDFGEAIIESMASFAQQFGALLIATGIGKIAFSKFSGPQMIAAGAALVALGGAVKSLIAKRPSLGGGGGGGGELPGQSPSEYYAGAGRQRLAVEVSGRVSGESIRLVEEKTTYRKSRLG